MRKTPILAALLLSACTAAPAPSPVPVTTPGAFAAVSFPSTWPYRSQAQAVVGRNAMVTSDAPLASDAGVEILRAGGNAVDAAVAVGFALAVVYPEAGNLGGGGFTLVRMADGRVAGIDYREVAPLSASRDMFLDDSGRATARSRVGPLASGVPGSVAGMIATHQRFGTLPLARVLAPAIRLAEGFSVDSMLSHRIAEYATLISQFGGASLLLPNGQPLATGTVLRQPALGRTLRAIADSGAAGFYRGGIARTFVEDFRAAGGNISAEDLAAYKPEWREPIRATYRGHVLLTMPPPSSGMTMIEALNILEGFHPMPPYGSPRYFHVVAASLQRAFVDRNARLADPAFARVPVDSFTNKSYAAKLRAGIGEKASPTPALLASRSEGSHTTHYAVVDAAGNAVTTTTTINDLFGSGVYLPNVGIFMNDEMDDFAAAPGKPNLFGLIQGEQNAVQPGKRMISSMLPTIVVDRAGRPVLLVGARGGPRIISAVMQTIINVVDHRMTLADAISAPRVHHQALPDTLRYETGGLAAETLDSLRARGYAVPAAGAGALASVNGIMRAGNVWIGFSDPRSGGRPAGY